MICLNDFFLFDYEDGDNDEIEIDTNVFELEKNEDYLINYDFIKPKIFKVNNYNFLKKKREESLVKDKKKCPWSEQEVLILL